MAGFKEMINPFQAIFERLECIEKSIQDFQSKPSIHQASLPEIGGINMAREITGLSKSTIYNLSSAHRIPCYKQAKRLYFKRSELLNWLLENNKVGCADEVKTNLKLGSRSN